MPPAYVEELERRRLSLFRLSPALPPDLTAQMGRSQISPAQGFPGYGTGKEYREYILSSVRQNGLTLKYAAEEVNVREVVLAAVQQNGLALKYALENTKRNRQVVLAAVRQNGIALRYAANALKNDIKIVSAAVRQNGGALRFAAEELQILLGEAAGDMLTFARSETATARLETAAARSEMADTRSETAASDTVRAAETKAARVRESELSSTLTAARAEIAEMVAAKKNWRAADDAKGERIAELEMQLQKQQQLQLQEHAIVDISSSAAKPSISDASDATPSTLKRIADVLDMSAERVVRVKRERDEHESRSELLDSMVTPLEEQRRILQQQATEVKSELIAACIPTKRRNDANIPRELFYYCTASYTSMQEIPWNCSENRAMTLAEGVRWACGRACLEERNDLSSFGAM